MIAPDMRLLGGFALLALPLSLMATAYPGFSTLALVLVGGFLAIALLDALRACNRLDGVSAETAAVARLTKDRPGTLEFRLEDKRACLRRLRIGLALPAGLELPYEDTVLAMSPAGGPVRVSWPCVPRQRGCHQLDRIHLEAGSPWRLWVVRGSAPLRGEIRVYPNLWAERRELAPLFLKRGTVGVHARRQVGRGREFEQLREYVPGDSREDIHWKATARRGHPITKVFQIERAQEVYVVMDASRLSARKEPAPARGGPANGARGAAPPMPEPALERFLTAALVLALAAEQQGDLFGLLTFSDQVTTFLRAGNGRAHYNLCRDALYTLAPRLVAPDFDEIAAFIRLRLRRRALLVFLTALDDPVLAESFIRNAELLSSQHLLLVNMLRPAGAVPVFSRGDVAGVDDLYRHLGGHVRWHGLRELGLVLQRHGVRFSLLDPERLSTQLVSGYLNVKRRQLL